MATRMRQYVMEQRNAGVGDGESGAKRKTTGGKRGRGVLGSKRKIASHFILFYPLFCHVPLGDELDQYLNVDQWEKKSEEKIKDEGGRCGRNKGNTREYEWLNQLASSVSFIGVIQLGGE